MEMSGFNKKVIQTSLFNNLKYVLISGSSSILRLNTETSPK